MGNIRFTGLLNRIVLSTTAVVFVTSSMGLGANQYEMKAMQLGIGLGDIAFVARIEKLIERAKRYKDRLESGKLIEVMFELKTEVEGYTGRVIDMDSHFKHIEKEAKARGAKIDPGHMKKIKSDLKKKGKKKGHKNFYMAECNMYGVDFDQEAIDLDFALMQAKHGGKEGQEEKEVPVRLSIGVTASLCGYFLSFIPHPYAQGASKFLIMVGVEMCIESVVSSEEKKQEERTQGK